MEGAAFAAFWPFLPSGLEVLDVAFGCCCTSREFSNILNFEVALVFMLSIYRQRLLIMETLVEEIIMRYRFCHLHDDVMRIMSCLSHRLGRNIEQYNEPYPGIQGCNCILPIKLKTVALKLAKLLCASYDL